MAVSYTFFFLLSTWSLSYATTVLGFDNKEFLLLLMGSVIAFGGMIVYSSILSDKFGRRKVLLIRDDCYRRVCIRLSVLLSRTAKYLGKLVLPVGWLCSDGDRVWPNRCVIARAIPNQYPIFRCRHCLQHVSNCRCSICSNHCIVVSNGMGNSCRWLLPGDHGGCVNGCPVLYEGNEGD